MIKMETIEDCDSGWDDRDLGEDTIELCEFLLEKHPRDNYGRILLNYLEVDEVCNYERPDFDHRGIYLNPYDHGPLYTDLRICMEDAKAAVLAIEDKSKRERLISHWNVICGEKDFQAGLMFVIQKHHVYYDDIDFTSMGYDHHGDPKWLSAFVISDRIEPERCIVLPSECYPEVDAIMSFLCSSILITDSSGNKKIPSEEFVDTHLGMFIYLEPYIDVEVYVDWVLESICNLPESILRTELSEAFESLFANGGISRSECLEHMELWVRQHTDLPADVRCDIEIYPYIQTTVLDHFEIKPAENPRSDAKTKAWVGAVKLRDGFQCKRCGSNERLNAHHILPICTDPELAYDINNGITLCESCHNAFHSKYGNSSIGHYECYEFLKNQDSGSSIDNQVTA